MDQRVSQILSPNPLLQDWDAPYGLPPFDAIRAEHFVPALQVAMLANRAELDAIATQAEPPSFDNTVAAFDNTASMRPSCRQCSARWQRRCRRTTARCSCMPGCLRGSMRCTRGASRWR